MIFRNYQPIFLGNILGPMLNFFPAMFLGQTDIAHPQLLGDTDGGSSRVFSSNTH